MEDMMMEWLDFIVPYMILVMLLVFAATVCALCIAVIGAVCTAVGGFRAAFVGRKKCSSPEHNRCYGALRRKK